MKKNIITENEIPDIPEKELTEINNEPDRLSNLYNIYKAILIDKK